MTLIHRAENGDGNMIRTVSLTHHLAVVGLGASVIASLVTYLYAATSIPAEVAKQVEYRFNERIALERSIADEAHHRIDWRIDALDKRIDRIEARR